MAGGIATALGAKSIKSGQKANDATQESPWVRRLVIGTGLVYFFLFLLLPLGSVFVEALRKGWDAYLAALIDPDAWSAIKLTLLIAVVSVPLNLVFGVTAAWAITKFQFPGKRFLITLIDLPFSVSPVIAGLILLWWVS